MSPLSFTVLFVRILYLFFFPESPSLPTPSPEIGLHYVALTDLELFTWTKLPKNHRDHLPLPTKSWGVPPCQKSLLFVMYVCAPGCMCKDISPFEISVLTLSLMFC